MQKSAMTSGIITASGRLITQLVKSNREILCDDFREEVTKAGQNWMKKLSESVGENILHSANEKKPTKERLGAINTALPSSTSGKNKKGRIPIQQAYRNNAST